MFMQAEVELRGHRQWLGPLLCFVFGAIIIFAGYSPGILFQTRMWMRLGLCILFLAGLFFFQRGKPAWETDYAFLAVAAGLLAAGLVGAPLLGWLGISGEDARGYAVSKIGETLPIIVIILLLVRWSGRDFSGLYLRRGRLGRSLLGGLLVGLVLFGYFLSQGGWQVFVGSNLITLLPVIGWMTIFSVFNGFMEELWFRGLFLSRFETLLGKGWAFWLTTLLFGGLHALGNFTGTIGSLLLVVFTLLLGAAFGYIVQRTGSLWGAVLGHFFADFFFMLGYFATAA